MALPVWSGVQFGPLGTRIRRILDRLAQGTSGLYITSAYRPRDTGSYHGGLNGGAAVDVGFGYGSSGYTARARAIASKLYAHPADVQELIVSKVGTGNSNGGYYIKNGRRVSAYAHTGSNTSVRHEDHVHVAMMPAQVARWEARLAGGSSGSGSSSSSKASNSLPGGKLTYRTPPPDRPVLRQGALGSWSFRAQQLLRGLGAKIDTFDNAPFGPQSVAATVTFQRKHSHLANDGVIGPKTWAQLELEFRWRTAPGNRPIRKQGDGDAWTFVIQESLRRDGYKIDNLYDYPFGAQTHASTVAFQRKYSWLQNDGVVGPNTWVALDAVAKGQTPKNPNPSTPSPPPPPASGTMVKPAGTPPVIRQGDSGPWVGYAQDILREKGGYTIDRLPDADFPFGPQTQTAMVSFQGRSDVASRGIEASGVVGPKTWAALEDLKSGTLPKSPPGTPAPPPPPSAPGLTDREVELMTELLAELKKR